MVWMEQAEKDRMLEIADDVFTECGEKPYTMQRLRRALDLEDSSRYESFSFDRAGVTGLLFIAVDVFDTAAARRLINDYNVEVNMKDNARWTPLVHAVLHRDAEMGVALAEGGADVAGARATLDGLLKASTASRHVELYQWGLSTLGQVECAMKVSGQLRRAEPASAGLQPAAVRMQKSTTVGGWMASLGSDS